MARGRPRTPLAKAEATGRTLINPGRFRDRKEHPSTPLGKPSLEMGPIEVGCWEAFKREVPWLKEADRTIVETACTLRAKVWLGTASDTTIGKLLSCLNAMGATPAARSKITVPDEDDAKDPASEFLN